MSQQKLLKVIEEDLDACRQAATSLHPTDEDGKDRNFLEFTTLMWHLRWARNASDQAALERVVASSEKNDFLRGYQDWRKRSEEVSSDGSVEHANKRGKSRAVGAS